MYLIQTWVSWPLRQGFVLMLGIAMVMFVTPWGSRCEAERLIDCIYIVGNLYL